MSTTILHIAPDPLTLTLLWTCFGVTCAGLVVLLYIASKKPLGAAETTATLGTEKKAAVSASTALAKEGDPHLPIVVAAAVNELLEGQKHRIVRIRPLDNPTWVEQGRCDIFQSRNTL